MARVRIGTVAELCDGALHNVEAGGTKLIVGTAGGVLCAARNRCPHLGWSLTTGPGGKRFEDGVVTCAWHNSTFDLATGANQDWATGFAGKQMPRWSQKLIALGRTPAPLETYEVSVEGEDAYVEV